LFIYILKRFISGFIILLIYISLVFFLSQEILPGDYVSQHAMQLSPNQAAELREILGLDQPIHIRYINWLTGLMRGDLGRSYTPFGPQPDVSDIIKDVLPPTLFVFLTGLLVAFIIGIWLGKVSAWRGTGIVSSSISFVSIAFYTSFPPWLAFLILYITSIVLDLPVSLGGRPNFSVPGMRGVEIMVYMLISLAVISIIVFLLSRILERKKFISIPSGMVAVLITICWVISWFLLDIAPQALEILRRASLPILAFVLLSFGEIMLIMRTSMMDTVHEDYVYAAKAKGLPEKEVRDKHAARNALMPVVSRLIISLPFLLSGMVMIEQALRWEGTGNTLLYAVGMQNIPLFSGLILVIGLISLAARMVLEVVQVVIDPRLEG
jgi:peptide/nickel transport system permease protein